MFDNIPSGPASGDMIATGPSQPYATRDNSSPVEPVAEEMSTAETPVEAAPVEQPKLNPTIQESNFNKLRREKERAEQERNEAVRLLREMESRLPRQQEPQQEESFNLKEDEIPEWRHVNKAIEKRYSQIDERLRQYEQRSAQAALKSNFPDLEKVVTDENLRSLRDMDPDLAESILANPNPYSQYAAAYRQIKLHGIYTEDTYGPERDRAQKNAAKPRPLASVSPQQSDSPLSQVNAFANGLTPELKKQLNIEMNEAIKRRNG